MKAANPVAMAVNPGPTIRTICSTPAAAAQAPAFSRPIQRNAVQVSNATSTFVASSINMYC